MGLFALSAGSNKFSTPFFLSLLTFDKHMIPNPRLDRIQTFTVSELESSARVFAAVRLREFNYR